MASTTIWMISLTISLCAIVLSAAAQMPQLHMAITGIVSLAFAVLAVRERKTLQDANTSKTAIASSTARYMGLVWVWGALGLLITYYFILSWKEWWQFFLAFAGIGALCLYFAASLGRDAEAGKEDQAILQIARYLTIAQLVGMVVTVIGLVIDNKMPRDPSLPDWAASNIFFFGALALALISANALRNGTAGKS